jgi:hypothetical protein
MKTEKPKSAYSIKEDGIYKLQGKNYVKINDSKEIEKAWAWIEKRRPKMKAVSEAIKDIDHLKIMADKLVAMESYYAPNNTPVPGNESETVEKPTALESIHFRMEDENDSTRRLLMRICVIMDRVSPMEEKNKAPLPNTTDDCSLLSKMSNCVITHSSINSELREVVAHMEENL